MKKIVNIIDKTKRFKNKLFKIVKGGEKEREKKREKDRELDDHNDSSNWSYS